jgi:AP2-associated kinase
LYLTLIIGLFVKSEVICNLFFTYHWQALGCLLYRICYFKSAFDGESKLQVLNGNYRIPEQPKYSAAVTGLIKDMLEASPNARPDITQARALIDWPFISMILG